MPGNQPPQDDIIPTNGWLMDINGGVLVSPHITKVTGLNKKTGVIEIVDGGTNRKLSFSDGISDYGKIGLHRDRDGSPADAAFAKFIDDCIANGKKVAGTLVQYRFAKLVMQIDFKGLLMHDFKLGDLNTKGTDPHEQSYDAPVDQWVETYF